MKLIQGIHNFNKMSKGCALTIGNFDGVHRGHQALLKEFCKESEIRNLPTVVMIFEPQPLEFFFGKKAPARLTPLREKLRYLSEYDIDYVLCVHFDQYFADLTAENFVIDLLLKRLGVKFLVVGNDFRFGTGRQGNFSFLQKVALEHGFDVIRSIAFCNNGLRISSTAVRKALSDDRLDIVETLLGHPYSISGCVVHGNALGRTIGFPTANILFHHVSPVNGVYTVDVLGIGNNSHPAVANIGSRPTFSGIREQLEVHLLDIVIDLYGRYIDVILRKKIRNEQRFASLDDLKKQITRDALIARKFFGLSVPISSLK